jgi:hypothetical protein
VKTRTDGAVTTEAQEGVASGSKSPRRIQAQRREWRSCSTLPESLLNEDDDDGSSASWLSEVSGTLDDKGRGVDEKRAMMTDERDGHDEEGGASHSQPRCSMKGEGALCTTNSKVEWF